MSTHDVPAHTVGARLSYVYAVGRSRGLEREAFTDHAGQDGTPLRTVTASGLAALVSSVPVEAFGTEGLKAQMEDLSRLEALARTHHAVVETAYESTTVLPMRLATVYIDDARVAEMLLDRGPEFDALISELEGQVEFGVKVYADPREAAGAGDEPEPGGESGPVSPGRAYLQRRRTQRRRHGDAYQAAGAVAAEVSARVTGIATAGMRHRPQQGELAVGAGENVSNEAYLVPGDQADAFRAALSDLSDRAPGARVEITGPWAPYSFATPPAGSGPDGGRP